MVRTKKFKAALAVVALGVSSQASFAATDTSCNPFARGADCNGVAVGSFGSSNGSTFTRAGIVSSSGVFQSPGFTPASGTASSFGQIVRSLPSRSREQAVVLVEDEADLDGIGEIIEAAVDEAEDIFEVAETTDEADGETDDGLSVVPVPASAGLLLLGLGGLAAMRRKKS